MPAALGDIRQALAAAAANVPGVRFTYPKVPGNPQVPCVVVQGPQAVDYDETFGRGSDVYSIPLTALVSLGAADERAQALLDDFIGDGLTGTVKGAIEADDTLGGVVSTLRVTGVRNYGFIDIGEASYLGCQFIVEVHA